MVEVERFARVRVRDGGARGRRIGADGSTSDRARFESLSFFLAGTGRNISPSHSSPSRLHVHVVLLEPSGECQRYHGAAVGKGRQAAKNEIEKLKLGEMSCEEAVKAVARIVYATHDEKDKDFECEMSWICDASGGEFKRVPKELADEAVELAKAALEEDDMDM